MTDRRNLYLRAADGDEEAERTLLAHLQRKVTLRDFERFKHARAGDRQLNLDVCGELVLQAARGDRHSRSRLLRVLSECEGARMATTKVGPSGPDGLAGPVARADVRAMGLQIAIAVAPADPWSIVPPLRVVVYEDE